METAPFRSIPMLCQELFIPSLHFECLQSDSALELLLLQLPRDIVVPVSAHPLSIEVNVHVDVEVSFRVNGQV